MWVREGVNTHNLLEAMKHLIERSTMEKGAKGEWKWRKTEM